MAQKYLTIKEYALLTHTAESTIRRNIKNGKIENATKVGGGIRIVINVDDEDKEPVFPCKDELIKALERIVISYNEIIKIIKNI